MLTKIRNNGSRNKIPGNIWVDSTVPVNTLRPWNRWRETAYAAKIAMITLNTVEVTHTIRLFGK